MQITACDICKTSKNLQKITPAFDDGSDYLSVLLEEIEKQIQRRAQTKVVIKKKSRMLSGESIKQIDEPITVTPNKLILLDTNDFVTWEYDLPQVEAMINIWRALRKMPEIEYIAIYPNK